MIGIKSLIIFIVQGFSTKLAAIHTNSMGGFGRMLVLFAKDGELVIGF